MKPYGNNAKKKHFFNKQMGHWCDCYLCVPVKKSTKKSERQKIKKEIKDIK